MLRSFGTTTLAAGVLAIAVSGMWSGGCSATKPTELVPGAITQVQVPKDLAGLKLVVKANGVTKLNNTYQVSNGLALLPATLGVVAGEGASTTVSILIGGFDQGGVQDPNSNYNDGTDRIIKVGASGGPIVKRGSSQTYVDQHTLFLPMPLSYACWLTDCGDDTLSTCKANQCLTSATDPKSLVDFDPSLVDGTQDCFSPANCFNNPAIPVVTAVVIDPTKCLYDIPPDEKVSGGLNVRLLYQDMKLVLNTATNTWESQTVQTSEQEILNIEPFDPSGASPVEGYAIPDPGKPTRFQLAPGLCKLVKAAATPPDPPTSGTAPVAYHTVSAVQVSTACASKPPLLPVCSTEQNPVTLQSDGGPTTNVVCGQPLTLVQAPSAIYMVMDNSSIMSGAFGPQGYATAMGLSLGNPLFKRTYVGFDFLDHNQADCTSATTPYTKPSLDFKLAAAAQPAIANLLLNPMPPDPAPDAGIEAGQQTPDGGFADLVLEGAMRPDVGAYKHLLDFAGGLGEPLGATAVMFFVNRVPDSRRGADGGLAQSMLDAGLPLGLDCDPALDADGGTSAKAALEAEISAAAAKGVSSYFVILNNGIDGLNQVTGTPLQFFKSIQSDLKSLPNAVEVLDATEPRTQAGTVLANFAQTATTLGTCLYELPPGVDQSANLSFIVPIPVAGITPAAPVSVGIRYNAQCTAATEATSDGWSIEDDHVHPAHIRICGSDAPKGASNADCWKLRLTVEGVTGAVLQASADGGTPNFPEVPVIAQMSCQDH